VLAYFDSIKCSNDVKYSKPAPDLYLASLHALGVRADQAIALEDSPNGVLAAQRAGIFCIAVPNPVTSRLSLSHADMQLTSLADIPLEQLLTDLQEKAAS
jgi:beta-phosphoglucomutase-like phosphatase (HAD superfamily)